MWRRVGSVLTMCAVLSSAEASDLVVSQLEVSVEERFDAFRGTFESLPAGFAVCKDKTGLMNGGDDDFRGTSPGGVTAGGCYAWLMSNTDRALGYQPTADEFTPGYFQLVLSNATAATARNLAVKYDVVYLNNADRASSLEVEISLDGLTFLRIPESFFITPPGRDEKARWKRCTYTLSFRFSRLVSPGDRVWIRWHGDDAGGSGSRDEYGVDNVRVALSPPAGTIISFR